MSVGGSVELLRVVLGAVALLLSVVALVVYARDMHWAWAHRITVGGWVIVVTTFAREVMRLIKQVFLVIASVAVLQAPAAFADPWLGLATTCQVIVLVLFIVTTGVDLVTRVMLQYTAHLESGTFDVRGLMLRQDDT